MAEPIMKKSSNLTELGLIMGDIKYFLNKLTIWFYCLMFVTQNSYGWSKLWIRKEEVISESICKYSTKIWSFMKLSVNIRVELSHLWISFF